MARDSLGSYFKNRINSFTSLGPTLNQHRKHRLEEVFCFSSYFMSLLGKGSMWSVVHFYQHLVLGTLHGRNINVFFRMWQTCILSYGFNWAEREKWAWRTYLIVFWFQRLGGEKENRLSGKQQQQQQKSNNNKKRQEKVYNLNVAPPVSKRGD